MEVADIFASLRTKRKAKAPEGGGAAADEPAKKKKKKKKKSPDPAAPKKAKKAAAAQQKAAVADADFFDLRGSTQQASLDAALGVGDDGTGTERKFVAIAGLQPSVEEIYEAALNERLAGIARPRMETDWVSHVVRLHFNAMEDALAAVTILDRSPLFNRKIRAGLSATRDGEVLVRNLLTHVTEDVIAQYMARFGTVLETKLLSRHAVWQKAYVQYADEADAFDVVEKLHGARNTVQDAPIFVSVTSRIGTRAAAPAADRAAKPASGPSDADLLAENSDDEPYTYDPNQWYA
ncbi:hypothetical protein DIPPA_06775 [Diplonema papillatum]|nr:hypothetical protein DIPPA_06775 [Diplonema papillatum]